MGVFKRFGCSVVVTGLVVTGSALSAGAATERTAAASGGAPITLYGIFDLTGPPGAIAFPENGVGFRAAVKAINAKGGVDGHKINGVVCDDQVNATAASNCAHSAVSAGAAAVIEDGQEIVTVDPIIIAAKIPLLELPLANEQLIEPNLYEIALGAAGSNSGSAVVQHQIFKATKNVYAGINVPAALASIPAWNATFKARGWPQGQVVLTPPGIPDAAPYAAKILQGGTQSVAMATDNSDIDKLTVAIRQDGSKIPLVRSALTTNAGDIKTLGQYGKDTYVLSSFLSPNDTSNAAVKNYVTQMNAISPSASKDDGSEGSWTNVYLFAEAAKLASSMTPAGIIAALNTHTFKLGLLPAVQFSKPVAGCGYARCFNDFGTLQKVSSGKLVSTTKNTFFSIYGNAKGIKAAGTVG